MGDDDFPSDPREAAIQRIKHKRAFQYQLVIYALVNVLLWVIWAATDFGFPWPAFVTVFWGIGLASQAWMIYRGAAPITEEQIQREMGRGGNPA
jgi:hypothetical protein